MRNKIESVRLSGRISTNTMTKEEVEFVKEQLENLTKTQLVRRAIKVLYKHETGQLYKDALRDIRDAVDMTEEREVTNKKVYDNLNEMIDRYR
jgi:hypothetical protein